MVSMSLYCFLFNANLHILLYKYKFSEYFVKFRRGNTFFQQYFFAGPRRPAGALYNDIFEKENERIINRKVV